MFNKSLAAIYFLGNRILAVEMDSLKKTVKKFAFIEIPAGLIEDYRIKDTGILSEGLKKLWNKNGFKEKTVGIVIPEFSTYTKLIKLPKLSLGELGEAIKWQAQEYLPKASEDLVIDWKIVEKSDEGIDILLVAISKEILWPYVEVCERAGLFPIAVQTPSSSLSNLVNRSEDKNLILYAGFGEVILVAMDKSKILGTSVLPDKDMKEVLTTTSRILSHFGKSDFKNILVGGTGISESTIKNIDTELGIPVTFLKSKASGIDTKTVNEYLIPFSMLEGDMREPSDAYTLNLLPGNLVDRYKHQKMRLQVWSLTLTMTLFVWVSMLLVMGAYMIISQQIASFKFENDNNSNISTTRNKLQSESTEINAVAAKVLMIKDANIYPEEILNMINKAKPQNVEIQRYRMDMEKGYFILNGISQNRTGLVDFRKNLETNKNIQNIDIPISSFEKESNLEFQLSFQYSHKVKPAVPAVPGAVTK